MGIAYFRKGGRYFSANLIGNKKIKRVTAKSVWFRDFDMKLVRRKIQRSNTTEWFEDDTGLIIRADHVFL